VEDSLEKRNGMGADPRASPCARMDHLERLRDFFRSAMQDRLWILVAGPYTSGTADAAKRAANLRALNQAALAVFRMGHVPVIGVNLALPIIDAAGVEAFHEIMMPLSVSLAERCDACLRIGGASQGADQEVARFLEDGRPVYYRLDEVPRLRLNA
jgi:hypothetical protein